LERISRIEVVVRLATAPRSLEGRTVYNLGFGVSINRILRNSKNLQLWTAHSIGATMNISYSPLPIGNLVNLPPAMEEVGHEFIKAVAFLLIPTECLYFSIYFHTKGAYKVYKILTFLAITIFWISPYAAPIGCGPVRCLQNFASTPICPLFS